MGSFGQASLRDVRRMLDACAEGYEMVETKHHFRVTWQGRCYPSLPKGAHKKRKAEIQVGKIRQMIRQLGIDMECAKSQLGVL